MADSLEKIVTIIEASLAACQSWTKEGEHKSLQLIDPIDGQAIRDHYGDSHLAASLIILSNIWNRPALRDQGRRILHVLLREWAQRMAMRNFHADFNNFALCLAEEALGDEDRALKRKIKEIILSSSDSRHDTINWLPMRVYVNLCRHEWSGDAKFLSAAKGLLAKVDEGTNADGGIEDRIPYGLSYSSQYNISSLAALMLLAKRWPDLDLQLEPQIAFAHTLPLPDGDINYVGRGTNQIFAWGPWFYVCSAQGHQRNLQTALEYVTPKYDMAVKHKNVLLNSFHGSDKSFWWDYHYCSVYHAHFLLWSVLALRDAGTYESRAGCAHPPQASTGLDLDEGSSGGVRVFQGRALYPAEYGPAVCAVWLKQTGILYKGGLGPWQGLFGTEYPMGSILFQNYFGLIQETGSKRLFRRRSLATNIMRRLPRLSTERLRMLVTPVFSKITVVSEGDALEITFGGAKQDAYLNIPLFEDKASAVDLAVWVDGESVDIVRAGTTRNQYGWVQVWRSRMVVGEEWIVSLRPKAELRAR